VTVELVPITGLPEIAPGDDLAALLDALGVRDAILCGLSMGGYVIFEFLRRWPGRVRGIALVDTRAEADTVDGRRARDAAAALARENGASAVADAMLPKIFSPGTLTGAPETVERVRTLMAATPVSGIIGALAAMRDRPDSTSLLPTLSRLPALVVVGEDDQLTPPDAARRMAEAVRGARLVVVPRAGHLAPVESPGDVTRVLKEFAEGIRG